MKPDMKPKTKVNRRFIEDSCIILGTSFIYGFLVYYITQSLFISATAFGGVVLVCLLLALHDYRQGN